MTLSLGLIICTRNRPHMLNELLSSIQSSEIKPDSVYIVSSGDDVSTTIDGYRENLKIQHRHTTKIGQSNQKIIAIQMLDPFIDWVFFLDDDLKLTKNTLRNVMNCINRIEHKDIDGIGARIISALDSKNAVRGMRGVANAGKINKSGRATRYMFEEQIETEWLNGVSIWRRNCLKFYDPPILNSRYAAYEDVIFSSRVAEQSKLLYDPLIEVIEQINHSQQTITLSQFKYITFWTGFLVCNLESTDIRSFKVLTILRTFHFSLKQRDFKLLLNSLLFTLMIIRLPQNKKQALDKILELINQETHNSKVQNITG
jgi:glycosyltransferase involved in cell wall biosynthesis